MAALLSMHNLYLQLFANTGSLGLIRAGFYSLTGIVMAGLTRC